MRKIGRFLLLLAFGYLGLVLLVFFFQRNLLYLPHHGTDQALERKASQVNYLPWHNGQDKRIGWRPATSQGERILLVFHGNAGHAGHRLHYGQTGTVLDPEWTVYLFEYPGYADRAGSPSESTITAAAAEAVELLSGIYPDSPLWLLGESIGSGVACAIAERFPDRVGGLLLITPFDRLASVAGAHYPFLPVEWLLLDRYENQKALENYKGPLAVILAENDEVIPTRFGQALYDSYEGPKWLHIQKGRSHNNLELNPWASWWREFQTFANR